MAKMKSGWKTAVSIVFWLVVWQVAAMLMGQELFLPSPLRVVQSFVSLAGTALFWRSAFTSLWRIGLGFLLGLLLGVLLAWAAAASAFIETLLQPLMLLTKATPVASFIILALLWIGSRMLATFASFLMVLPVIYNATLTGIHSADGDLLEVATVFRVPFWRKVRYMYLPALAPSLLSACELALGLAWKSGVAAEVIGLSQATIGERLFQAKLYYLTSEVFAWTALIILLSWASTKLLLWGMRKMLLYRRKEAPRG